MAQLSDRGLGWKEIGACVAIIVIFLLLSATLSPTRGIGTTAKYRETTFVRAFVTREVSSGSANNTAASVFSEGDATDKLVTEKDLTPETRDRESHTAASEDGTALEGLKTPTQESSDDNAAVEHRATVNGSVQSTEEGAAVQGREKKTQQTKPKKHYRYNPEENFFVGDENAAATSFHLVSIGLVELVYAEMCTQCANGTCERDCQVHQALWDRLNQTAVESRDARLHVIPVDPLSWYRRTRGDSEEYRARLAEFVSLVKSAYPYHTFKGSDHVFVCLSNDGCLEFGEDLSKALAGNLGSRAIFAGVSVRNSSFRWPCPLRVIDLGTLDINNVTAVADRIVHRATFMIQNRNRWICADRSHPARHWYGLIGAQKATGAYMKNLGFSICAIPKCGSSMTIALLRRMRHRKSWNETGTGKNHGSRSGIKYMSHIRNTTELQAVNDDLSFVKAVIVRHPISRLLSGYLDKIYQKHQYGRIPGLKQCMFLHRGREPSFHSFVHCLIHKHPDPNHLDHHFRIQSSFCNLRKTELDFVGKQSHLRQEMREFGESLNFWERYGSSGWGDGTHAFGEKSYQSRTHDSGSLIWDYYTEDLMMEVYKYYKEDFDRFGFTLEEILATKPNRTSSEP